MRKVTATLRGHVIPICPPSRGGRKPGWRRQRFGQRVLVLDVETAKDTAQRLLVGSFRLYEWSDMAAGYALVDEGLFARDGLKGAELQCLIRYADENHLQVLTHGEFARLLIHEGYDKGTLIVGFNLKFDLGALAVQWGKGRKRWRGGWRLKFLPTKWEPPLRIRAVDSVITFFEWGAYRGMTRREGPGRRPFVGRLLDLRQWAHGLLGEKHSLESLAQALSLPESKAPHPPFGIVSRELLDYLRQDVEVTWQCFLRLRDIWNHDHPFLPCPSQPMRPGASPEETPELRHDTLLPTRVASGASLAEAYLKAMRIQPRLALQHNLPDDVLGWYMTAYFAGRSEAPITHAILPVRTLDMSNTYTSMCILAGLGGWLTASRLELRDCTQDLQNLLTRIEENPDLLYRRETLRLLTAVALIHPQGDVVPVRDRYDPEGDYTLSLNRVHAEPNVNLWYVGADLAASILLRGQVPRILKAVELVPRGQQGGLRHVRIGSMTVNPATLYPDLREGRLHAKAHRFDLQRRSLKAIMEPLAYGLFIKYTPRLTGATVCDAWGLHHFQAEIAEGHEEHPGEFTFPPHAAVVTAMARLMLAMAEYEVRQRGGAWATMDTDSIAIVAAERGGPVVPLRNEIAKPRPILHALSYDEVETIRAKFDALVPGLWRYEEENEPDRTLYALSLGTKRYAVANRDNHGHWIVRKESSHGLGHLTPPGQDWIKRSWQALFEAEEHGSEEPLRALPFADSPAVGVFPVTRPDVLDTLNGGNKVRSRPFAFFNVAYPTMAEYQRGWCRADREERVGCPRPDDVCPYRTNCPLVHPIRPIAPYEANLRKINGLPWSDLRTGESVRIIHGPDPDVVEPRAGRLIGRRILDVLRLHRDHADVRYVVPEPGVVSERQDVLITSIRYITKEMHNLQEAVAGLRSFDEVTYPLRLHLNGKSIKELRDGLRLWPAHVIAQETNRLGAPLSERTIKGIRNGHSTPRPVHRRVLLEVMNRLGHATDKPDKGDSDGRKDRPNPTGR